MDYAPVEILFSRHSLDADRFTSKNILFSGWNSGLINIIEEAFQVSAFQHFSPLKKAAFILFKIKKKIQLAIS